MAKKKKLPRRPPPHKIVMLEEFVTPVYCPAEYTPEQRRAALAQIRDAFSSAMVWFQDQLRREDSRLEL